MGKKKNERIKLQFEILDKWLFFFYSNMIISPKKKKRELKDNTQQRIFYGKRKITNLLP